MINILTSFLSDREQRVALDGQLSDWAKIEARVQKGEAKQAELRALVASGTQKVRARPALAAAGCPKQLAQIAHCRGPPRGGRACAAPYFPCRIFLRRFSFTNPSNLLVLRRF